MHSATPEIGIKRQTTRFGLDGGLFRRITFSSLEYCSLDRRANPLFFILLQSAMAIKIVKKRTTKFKSVRPPKDHVIDTDRPLGVTSPTVTTV